ncbi:hypothetical protein JL720_5960 [Aureococcus anophagefferens]|nr:hypothetical protein JL720_5960 [Aureococcus anophagefferens]
MCTSSAGRRTSASPGAPRRNARATRFAVSRGGSRRHAASSFRKPYKHVDLKDSDCLNRGSEIVSEGLVLGVAIAVRPPAPGRGARRVRLRRRRRRRLGREARPRQGHARAAGAANAGAAGVDFSADGLELYACYALPGGAFARHVARWAVAGGEPAAWDGDKRGVSALAAHEAAAPPPPGRRCVRLLQTTGTGAKRALAGTHATEVRRLAWTASGRSLTASPTPRRLWTAARTLAVAFVGDDLRPRAARRARRRPRPWTSRATPACARPSTAAGAAKAAQGRAGRRAQQPAVLGFAALGAAPRLRPDGEDGAARKRAAAAADDDAPGRPRGFRSPGDARRRRRAADLAATGRRGRGRRSGASLAAVLDQAVRCGDDALLETVLRRTEPATVARPARLAPSLALPTLDALAARLERSPLRAADLAGWVKALLLQHASHLATLPKLADTPLLQYRRKTGAAVSGAASAEVTPLNVVAADATDDEDEEEEDDTHGGEDDDDDESEEEEDDDDDDDSSDDDDE